MTASQLRREREQMKNQRLGLYPTAALIGREFDAMDDLIVKYRNLTDPCEDKALEQQLRGEYEAAAQAFLDSRARRLK